MNTISSVIWVLIFIGQTFIELKFFVKKDVSTVGNGIRKNRMEFDHAKSDNDTKAIP